VLRRTEFWGGLFWLAVGAFVTWQGWLLELGTLREPGSGFVFFWLGLFISALSLSIVFAGVRGNGPLVADLWRGARWRNVVLVIAALIAFGALFQQLGFVICCLALLLFLMTVVDPVSPKLSIPIALVASVGVWYVLEKVLLVQLPKGSWLEDVPYLSWLAG
jgi:putative tricarboxylic transport membrane protein